MKKALVIAFTLVLGLGIAAFAASPLSGSWSSSITMNPQTAPMVTDFSSTLIVDYTVGGWTFESTTGFALTGWNKQEFTANGTLGAFTLDSDLVFDPTGPSFTKWDSTGKVSIAGVDLSSEFLLTDSGSGWTFGASGTAGDLSLGATAYFNSYVDSNGTLHVQTAGYCFCFNKVEFTASAPFACIDKVNAKLDFDQSGFGGADFAVKGLAVPNVSWLTFDLDVSFATTSKSVTFTPNINLGKFACIELYYDIDTTTTSDGSPILSGIVIHGFGMSYTWNGVTFTDKTSLDTGSNKDITGNTDYFELFEIKSTGDSCCGGAVNFSIDTYFGQNGVSGSTLFGWGETDVSLSFGIGSNYTINTGLNVDSTGLTKITFGFKVTW